MKGKGWLAVGCLVAGIPLAAAGLAYGSPYLAVVGLALVLAFWFLAWQWIARTNRPETPIKPAADAAWSLRDHPARQTDGDEKR